VFLAL